MKATGILRSAILFGALGAVAACSRSNLDAITRLPEDAAADAAPDTGPDAAPDTGPDAAPDTGPDAAPDTGPDAAPDTGPDAAPDTGPDAAPDASPDVAPDVVPDTRPICPVPALAAGDTTQTLTIGGSIRNYVLHVPAAYSGTEPVPLILNFHAITGTGAREQKTSLFPATTDAEGVIMAFPSGLPGPIGTAWNVGPCCVDGVDDVTFARKIVEQVQGMACIDARRVYAVGTSMGGGMAYYLACRAADVFAAIAPSAFDLLQEQLPECNPPRQITVISFRGNADNVVPYDGGYSTTVPGMPVNFLGAVRTFQQWALIDQCSGSPSQADVNGCSSYTACQGGVEVVLCTKQGGGQAPPDPAIAWPVLKRHTL